MNFLLDFAGFQVVHIDVYAIYSIESVLYIIASAGFRGIRPSFSIPVMDGMVERKRSGLREVRELLVIVNYGDLRRFCKA